MSLIKLLTVGKSLVSNKNGPARYRMTEQGMLPKFAPVGRPVALAPKPENRGMSDSDRYRAETRSAANPAPTPTTPTRQALEYSTAPAQRGGAVPSAHSSPVAPAATCLNSVPVNTDFFRLKRVAAAFGRAGGPSRKAPVQSELALDAVKVVRNDLSDADVEIVPTTAAPPPEPDRDRPSKERVLKTELTGVAWSRLTARWFGSSRVRA
jgi:hypothetical protein